jgi:hypothetical protein
MTDEIPYWALQRAAELANREGGEVGAARGAYTPDELAYTYIGRTFARYIAQHEEPPVDPLLIEAREIAAKFFEENGTPIASGNCRAGKMDSMPLVRLTAEALRRGIELGKAGAA